MTKFQFTLAFLILVSFSCKAQDDYNQLNDAKGFRMLKSSQYLKIFPNIADKVDTTDYRKLDNSVFFKYIHKSWAKFNGSTYSLISIPGQRASNQAFTGLMNDPRNGARVSPDDYDRNFWIKDDDTSRALRTEYFKYKSDLISGVLTSPFKLRVKTRYTKEAYLDGSFNLGAFVGYKVSFGTQTPSYISLIGFLSATSISYNSSNNKAITDTSTKSGFGYSYGIGLVLRFANVSPGIILGWDHGLGDDAQKFIYQDHPWLSFSINFDFIKPKQDTKAKN